MIKRLKGYFGFNVAAAAKPRPRTISKSLRRAVWNTYASRHRRIWWCYVGCGDEINIDNFHCGHVIAAANGGPESIENLRPICENCNKTMGVQNLMEYVEKCGLVIPPADVDVAEIGPLWSHFERDVLVRVAADLGISGVSAFSEKSDVIILLSGDSCREWILRKCRVTDDKKLRKAAAAAAVNYYAKDRSRTAAEIAKSPLAAAAVSFIF